MASLNEIRTQFLDFFARNDHEIVPSGSLVPHNDPSLMFTNAGMVPFKNVFTGLEQREVPRAASAQKCVRAGGKHNDLDNVGYTARHHTFFEMLGNFSFGDYFKERAIELAWTLVSKEFSLSADRLVVTVFAEDEEAGQIWKKVSGLPESRIIRIATSDNFWSMGDTGPCGPCSEIFYDHGDHIAGGPPGSLDEDGDRFVEIWNLVFMQFDQMADGERADLPKPSIDTGMGLERIAAVLQGTHDNYETDLFKRLIATSVDFTGVAADGERKVSHRVIADHLRAMAFLIADGVLPSNEGRGYVLRRIMRRAMRHAHILGTSEPTICRMVPELVAAMGEAYPELGRAQALVQETIKLEEERFQRMLGRGLSLLDDATASLNQGDVLSGEVAFKLYDTYGFPLDLTQDALRPRSISVDVKGFETQMARQKAEARAAWAGSGESATEALWFDLRDKVGATEFLGYTENETQGEITALLKDGQAVDALKKGDEGSMLLNQTVFYAESGGQVGDTGIIFGEGVLFRVRDVRKHVGNVHEHIGVVEQGSLAVGDVVTGQVDEDRRLSIRSNHSATHLLHAALRSVLGAHVTQKGSLVDGDRLRFDFSHPKALTKEEIEEVEAEVNRVIRQNQDVSTRLMAQKDAIDAGALALFGEKYGDEVRVLTMGQALVAGGKPYSVELCGGTHVGRLGDIGVFKIVSEGAVASGVRRIEALTGEAARTYLDGQADLISRAAGLLKTTAPEVPGRIEVLLDERRKLEREMADLRKKVAMGGGGPAAAGDSVKTVKGVKVLAAKLDGVAAKELRSLIDEGKKKIGSGVVAFVTVSDGKAAAAVGVTEDLTSKLDAVALVKGGAVVLGGKGGGGRPDLAQAGGPDGAKAQEALDRIVAMVGEGA